MEDLTFKLAGVVKGKAEQENFEGPLALILQLLSKNRIEIRDIQIALILEQYLEYLEKMEKMDLEIASEFVTMAAHLVYIKTRMLLDSEKEIDELEELISSLENLKSKEVYVQIKEMTETFRELYKTGSGLGVKPREIIAQNKEYRYTHDKQELYSAIQNVLARSDSEGGLTAINGIVVPRSIIYPVAEKSEEILTLLKNNGNLKISELFKSAKSRTELVAAFLSVLELCKDGGIILTGADDELTITRTETSETDEIEGGVEIGNS